MYVFVDIGVDVRHLVATVQANFSTGTNLALAGTIQFGSSIQVQRCAMSSSCCLWHAAGLEAACRLDCMQPRTWRRYGCDSGMLISTRMTQAARQALAGDYPSLRIPQSRPLSPGEVRRLDRWHRPCSRV